MKKESGSCVAYGVLGLMLICTGTAFVGILLQNFGASEGPLFAKVIANGCLSSVFLFMALTGIGAIVKAIQLRNGRF